MSQIKLQLWGLAPGKTRRQLELERELLETAQRDLKRQRAEQSVRLLRFDHETEEIKRRLSAAQTRLQFIRNGADAFWVEDAAPSTAAAEAAAALLSAPALNPQPSSLTDVGQVPKPRLGDQLIENRIITVEQLDEAFEIQRVHGGRLGDVLIELGYVTAAQLLPFISNQPQKGRLGDMLIQLGYLTKDQLDKALIFQRKSGGMLGDVLLSLQFLEPEQLYRAIATQNNIGRIGNDVQFDADLKIPEPIAREYGVVVIHNYTNRYLVAVNEPLSDERKEVLEKHLEKPIEQVLASKNEMEMFWSEVYGNEMLHESTQKLADNQPHNSASITFTRGQLVTVFILLALLIASLFLDALKTLITLNIVIQVFYFFMTTFKFLIIMYGSRSGSQYRFTEEQIAAIDERDLPIYSILVPMYKESEVIPHLIRNLEKLDYPKAKLDVRLLIEKDDVVAQEMLKSMKLPPYYTVLIVPDSLPKTKPKACNFGLLRARGKYVVIFDAEDRPDADQLKKVHLTFQACSEETVCVQGKLNYFNSEQNLLTRWFTQEYSMWFELLLPGIMRLDIPIPLGGTSNHFKTDILKQLDAWDPYNVTEDADLGIRLYKEGYKTAIVDSRTWEEANSRFGNWIRQRSRWIKGYMQTWLVHMRNPVKLYKELGLRGFLGMQVMVLATPMIPLLNPIFWLMVVLWYSAKLDFIPMFFPGIIYYLSAFELYVANFFFVYSSVAGVYWVINDLEKRGEYVISHRLVKYALLTPLYWMMMSISAYKAAWQLITKPFYWEKTTHGLDNTDNVEQPAVYSDKGAAL